MRRPFFYKTLDASSQQVLKSNFKFYQNLSHRQQKLFNHRVVAFMEHHQFIGREGIVVDRLIKLLVSGTAVMLSFGFDRYLYSLFDTIIVYPQHYFSKQTQQEHKGETNPALGVIVFSWEDFKEGIIIEHDNLHLGLHKFAHALQFSFLNERSHEARVFKHHFDLILYHLKDADVRHRLINTGYLRHYAFENQYEFFAVMVEHFYESPSDFMTTLPTLYQLMAKLLQVSKIMD